MKAIVVVLVALLLAAFMVGCGQYTQPTAPFGDEGFMKVVTNDEAGIKIRYYVPSSGEITISVSGKAGQEVVVLLQQEQGVGEYDLKWSYMIQEGVRCPPGKYDLIYTAVGVIEVDGVIVP